MGHELMGDDGSPRVVQRVVTGIDRLYEIAFGSAENEPLVVTGNHILCLKSNLSQDKGEIYEMTVEEYLRLPVDVQRTLLFYRAPCLAMNGSMGVERMPVHPY